ncbi:hypothetical protein TUBRATIS_19900 [Tubulinosema ratisbonensis]|uniref:Uncharacterized protein n=1 Tax=Tubulinosema ratisbonensis TaxID=291195 RepID=A0A437AKE8_9MICR|nr:hypothetical protein TUBRATIS_19900 [Tubulinosema ratisbonensis]
MSDKRESNLNNKINKETSPKIYAKLCNENELIEIKSFYYIHFNFDLVYEHNEAQWYLTAKTKIKLNDFLVCKNKRVPLETYSQISFHERNLVNQDSFHKILIQKKRRKTLIFEDFIIQ